MTAKGSKLDDARRALYAGSRATFVERRKELAGAARNGGDRDEAKLIGAMRKPTAAAHLVNLLAQADDSSLREVVELGASIRGAMAKGDGREMRSLLQGRPAALAKTVAQAQKMARANGEPVSEAVGEQIIQTLRAAMASDEAAAAVHGGTLTEALDEPGFDGLGIEPAAPATSPTSSAQSKAQSKPDLAPDREADEAAARAAAQARIKSAAAEVKRTEKELATATRRRDRLGRDRDTLASELARIDAELDAAHSEVAAVEARIRDAAVESEAASDAAAPLA